MQAFSGLRSAARTPGYDAVDSTGRRIQIKARSISRDKKLAAQRLGSIRLDHEWDVGRLIVTNEFFELRWIFKADRPVIEEASKAPGSKARNEGGALALAKFKHTGRQVWPADTQSLPAERATKAFRAQIRPKPDAARKENEASPDCLGQRRRVS